MLALTPTPQHDIPLREHSHLNLQNHAHDTRNGTSLGMEDRLCPGCKKSAVSENGGLVVAFGQSFFHVDCFKCAKCGDQVTADTNLLLLSDGSPICANCSYSCNVCHLPILDEAIMTGDDSYHAHCFKCKVCKNRIDELVFAKTSQGIYCMGCHSERMIKIRKHAQKKAEREKAVGGSGSSKSRERDARLHLRENGRSSPGMERSVSPSELLGISRSPAPTSRDGQLDSGRAGSSRGTESTSSIRSPAKRRSGPYVSDAFEANGQTSSPSFATYPLRNSLGNNPATTSTLSSPSPFFQQPISVTVAPPPELEYTSASIPQSIFIPPRLDTPATSGELPRPTPSQKNTLPIPPNTGDDSNGSIQRRKSYDDGVRPLNILFKLNSEPNNHVEGRNISEGLGISTSRRDKRRSINPGLVLTQFNKPVSPSASSPTLSPLSVTFHGQQYSNSYTTPTLDGRDSPQISSPLGDHFPDDSQSRPTSRTSLLINSSSPLPSTTSSPALPHNDQWPDISRSRSASASTYSHDQGGDARSPLRPDVTSDGVLSGPSNSEQGSLRHLSDGAGKERPPSGLSPINGNAIRLQRSFDTRPRPQRLSSTSSFHTHRSRSTSRSRPNSPAHRVDVPHSVESGTDTEAEGDGSFPEDNSDIPPALPPKEMKDHNTHKPPTEMTISPTSDVDPNASNASTFSRHDSGSDMSESSPVERMSHATFIAPALPPIRFSMNSADFSDLFSSVGGAPSLKSLEQMAMLSENHEDDTTLTPSLPVTSVANGSAPPSDPTSFNSAPHTPIIQSEESGYAPNSATTKGYHEKPSKADNHLFDRALDSSDSSHEFSQSYTSSHQGSPPESVRHHVESKSVNNGSVSNLSDFTSSARITLTEPESTISKTLRYDTSDIVMRRLQEAMADARERGAQQLKLDRGFVEAIIAAMESRNIECAELKGKFDGIKRASKQYIDGLTVAQAEYDQELKARRDAEAEVTRLRVLLSGQVARLTALSGDSRRQELREQLSKDLSDNLTGLEHDLSKLRVERDMTLAEVEELSASKSSNSADPPTANLSRSLTMRLDNIKIQYQHELVPLTQQRETLTREIAELKAVRDVFLEETTALNARNEELAQLSTQYARRMDTVRETPPKQEDLFSEKRGDSIDKAPPPTNQSPTFPHSLSLSTTSSSFNIDDAVDSKFIKVQKAEVDFPTPSSKKFMKWPGSKAKEIVNTFVAPDGVSRGKAHLEHSFQQLSVLRFTRCDHCGDKMWGSQLRCSGCNISVHVRCINLVNILCLQQSSTGRDELQLGPMPPSMFGRDLTEQVRADSKGGQRQVPVIVEKCIDAVEALALEYEGIYRKTGGSGQSKAITQLFERGDYTTFDLRDSDRFNDICSVTSVLKTYFRSLPVPLLTYDLHDNFMTAVQIRDPATKNKSLLELINKLPNEHYYTLRMLMLHLHRIRERSERNLMNARNLGVVFGPTLMRSRDPNAEFSDMAGKALSVEWLVENAPFIFSQNAVSN